MTSLAADFVRNFLCFDDFWPNAASAKSSHQEFADGLFLVISKKWYSSLRMEEWMSHMHRFFQRL